MGSEAIVEGEKTAHEGKGDAGLEHVPLVRELKVAKGAVALFFKKTVLFLEVEQGSGGNRHDEFARSFFNVFLHAVSLLKRGNGRPTVPLPFS